ncbi:M20/M25/M40 family metallo-hydrolase [Sphingobium terrigena]|uniref:M20/M25/M40 family metallo-hydrolase n=1 Tax=Sphingobium terrigena TaxID=2304063 RepID=A0A418YTT2_9SPHN|nr:M28 family metallopeptidase [Sphingobium terrigena]RJG55466.1 M20/M25/M40 family metallo-hydrolase [Sphingobium terrigena]
MTRAFLALSLLALPAHAQTVAPQQLEQSVRVLASDLFEGRAPGTVGEERTIGYLVGRFQALGLEPGGPDGQWVQSVPLLHTRLGKAETLGVTQGDAATPWNAGKDVYLSTLQPKDKVAISAAPLVFVGYGVSAPERGWDDFKGVDLKGKIAVFLINDPDFEAVKGDDAVGKFGGRTMTYYGRWTYKFEEAARRGAIGALIVHDTAGAGYGWNVVISPGGENYDLVRAPDKVTSLQLQGWIEGSAAAKLFSGAGLDLAVLLKQARSKRFRAVELKGASFSATFPVTQDIVKSANVLARIPGTKRPDETVMFGAHWDAYGKGAPDAQGRVYRAGANDDALGIAGLFEIARAFKAGPAPDRSVLFAAWTAEERGLLGSEHYAQNPVWPLDQTVANLTLDILQTAGKAKDVILVGKWQGTLEDDLAKAAAAQGRVVTPESLPERGLFYRADHFSMAKRGVPVLLLMGIAGASDLVEGGRVAGQAWVDAYTGQCYHQACDAIDATWKLDGAAQDVELMLDIGRDLATSTRWPQWKPGSEFKAVRDASAAARP